MSVCLPRSMVPTLPDLLDVADVVESGCYLLVLEGLSGQAGGLSGDFVGTMRVKGPPGSVKRRVSGDLYRRKVGQGRAPARIETHGGIPQFPVEDYCRYLRCVAVDPQPHSLRLKVEVHRYEEAGLVPCWVNVTSIDFDVVLSGASTNLTFAGDARENDVQIGKVELTRVSQFIRSAVVEMDYMPGCEVPEGSKANSKEWAPVYTKIGWNVAAYKDQCIKADSSDRNEAPVRIEATSADEDELAKTFDHLMHHWRGAEDYDVPWRYHLLCVNAVYDNMLGWMYDQRATDASVPREGAAVASLWKPTKLNGPGEPYADFKVLQDQKAAFFHTALHEVGHAQGLLHCSRDDKHRIMKTTCSIVNMEHSPNWQDKLMWEFHPEQEVALQHWPDLVVRPGGDVPFKPGFPSGDPAVEAPNGVSLHIKPVFDQVPLGAPVRVGLQLVAENGSDLLPAEISFARGNVRGWVECSCGIYRHEFRTLYRHVHDAGVVEPASSKNQVSHSITLLRGVKGELFPRCGKYRVCVTVSWNRGGKNYECEATTEVEVTGACKTAQEVLEEPGVFLWLVLGDRGVGKTREIIERIREDDTLRNHYSVVDAKWTAARGNEPERLERLAKKLLDEKVPVDEWVVTDRELWRLRRIAIQLGKKDIVALYDELIDKKSHHARAAL